MNVSVLKDMMVTIVRTVSKKFILLFIPFGDLGRSENFLVLRLVT